LSDLFKGKCRVIELLRAQSLGISTEGVLWYGALDSLAGRQLKWIYPANARDDEFLKRATLASTLFIDGLQPAVLRRFLESLGSRLHESSDRSRKPLAPRNLLQRVALICALIEHFRPKARRIVTLVKLAETKGRQKEDADLQEEAAGLLNEVRSDFAALAFLYDLRISGGSHIHLTKNKHRQLHSSSASQLRTGIARITFDFSS
jgi:hypothetical protein